MDTWTLKEIDQELKQAKGTTFRAFKKLEPQLIEGQDFFYYNGQQDAATVQQLQQAGRVYSSSLHALLFSHSTYLQLKQMLQAQS